MKKVMHSKSLTFPFKIKVKDGKLSKEGFKTMVEQMIGPDPEKMKNALKVLEVCSKIHETDPCDFAAKMSMCVESEGEKYGLKLSL